MCIFLSDLFSFYFHRNDTSYFAFAFSKKQKAINEHSSCKSTLFVLFVLVEKNGYQSRALITCVRAALSLIFSFVSLSSLFTPIDRLFFGVYISSLSLSLSPQLFLLRLSLCVYLFFEWVSFLYFFFSPLFGFSKCLITVFFLFSFSLSLLLEIFESLNRLRVYYCYVQWKDFV